MTKYDDDKERLSRINRILLARDRPGEHDDRGWAAALQKQQRHQPRSRRDRREADLGDLCNLLVIDAFYWSWRR
jgi:hypothetical protein